MRTIVFAIVVSVALVVGCGSPGTWVPCQNQNCTQCMGTGVYRCPACHGGGQVDCGTDLIDLLAGNADCHNGKVECTTCGGDGMFTDEKCTHCNGTGSEVCFDCSGTGKVKCEKCDAAGNARCGKWVRSGR